MAVLILILVTMCLILSAYNDVRQFRIPNIFPVVIIMLFLASRLWWGFTPADWGNALHFTIALAIGMVLFGIKWIGGGDAKLYAAIALWFSGLHAAMLIMATGLAGLVLAVAYVVARKSGWMKEVKKRSDRRIPYGLAIAGGGIAVGLSVGVNVLIPGA